MKTSTTPSSRFSPALWCGLAAFGVASGLGCIQLELAVVPLALFVLACMTAPFLPWLGFFLPVVSKGTTGKQLVALTFDDGPNPATTLALLALLAQLDVPATFFVTGARAEKYPDLVNAILKAGHSVGNHTYDHDYLALLLGPKALSIEIERGQKALAPLGIRPLAFRPPVGITTPVLGQVLHRMGMYAATFRFRAHDHGNLLLNNLAKATLERVRPDDILVLHDVKPARNQSVQRWLAEVRQLITGLGTKGLRITTLESLIDRPVMRKIK